MVFISGVEGRLRRSGEGLSTGELSDTEPNRAASRSGAEHLPVLPAYGIHAGSIRSFLTAGTRDINYGRDTKSARRTLPIDLHNRARVKLARLHAADSLLDLATLPGNRLEKLKGDRKGEYSMRINDKYRICFEWRNDAAENVEIVDYH